MKTPLFIFSRIGSSTHHAIGIISPPGEMNTAIQEPSSNRALNVHFRRLRIEFNIEHCAQVSGNSRRGETSYPIWIFIDKTQTQEHWTHVVRRYSQLEREKLSLSYADVDGALLPYWCTWVDWSSDQVNQQLVLDNMRAASQLGISNIIIDDGWFGPGLDSAYETNLNIGDWIPDPCKYEGFGQMIREAHDLGLKVILWCAPHAIGLSSQAYKTHRSMLIADRDGRPILNPTMFYSLCFRNPQARDIMVSVVDSLVQRFDIDGFKYDLFNWIPDEECRSPQHSHDLISAIEGLENVLKRAWEITSSPRRPMIIELKQDYAPPPFAVMGTVVRAGDAPFASQTNLMRTAWLQARGVPVLNDYQTFSTDSSAEEVCVIGLRMIASGVPAWGRNLTLLSAAQSAVLTNLHTWYKDLLEAGASAERVQDSDGSFIMHLSSGRKVVFSLDQDCVTHVASDVDHVVNASLGSCVYLQSDYPRVAISVHSLIDGSTREAVERLGPGVSRLKLAPGCVAKLDTMQESGVLG